MPPIAATDADTHNLVHRQPRRTSPTYTISPRSSCLLPLQPPRLSSPPARVPTAGAHPHARTTTQYAGWQPHGGSTDRHKSRKACLITALLASASHPQPSIMLESLSQATGSALHGVYCVTCALPAMCDGSLKPSSCTGMPNSDILPWIVMQPRNLSTFRHAAGGLA